MTDEILPNLMTLQEQQEALNLLQAVMDGDVPGLRWRISGFLQGFTAVPTWRRGA